jgi:hypothetical protein
MSALAALQSSPLSYGSTATITCATVRVQRSGKQQSGIAQFTLDTDRKSTTIRLWIGWVLPLRLCLIPPAGR